MLRVSLPSRPFANNSVLKTVMGVALLAAMAACSVHASEPPDAQAQQLRKDAGNAARQGDFVTAVGKIKDAARLSGDRLVEQQADEVAKSLQPAAGGSPFANPTQLIQLLKIAIGTPEQWVDENGEDRVQAFQAGQGVFVGAPAVLASLAIRGDDTHARILSAIELARTANHNTNVRDSSELRMVSLPRLEQHVQDLMALGEPIPDDIANLAGITKVKYLFVFRESGDLVIAGPAGDWIHDENGQGIGVDSGRPTLKLDDLVTLTRTFGHDGAGFFMCTIDPKQEQVRQVQELVRRNRRGLTPATAALWAQNLEDQLGLQNVFVKGIPADSRVASVIVEADYRMKEIGIGRRDGTVGMKSYFDLLTRSERRSSSSMDALRWWMTVGYEAINMSPGGDVFELTGQSVQCQSEDQLVNEDGSRKATGKARRPNAEFARLFTEHLSALAQQDPVFADLENVFDVALVSALLHSHGLARQVGWTPDVFASAGAFRTATVNVPEELMTAAAHRVYQDRSVVIQVAGGVQADLGSVVRDEANFRTVEELSTHTKSATPVGQQNNRWWWDVATR